MKIKIDGRTLPAKNLDSARVRDIAELQRQTGWKLEQMRSEIEGAEILGYAVMVFLSLRNAGAAPSWDECLDRELGDVEVIEEPGDTARAAVDDDPKALLEGSDQGDESPERKPRTRSSTASRGSKTKSGGA